MFVQVALISSSNFVKYSVYEEKLERNQQQQNQILQQEKNCVMKEKQTAELCKRTTGRTQNLNLRIFFRPSLQLLVWQTEHVQ